MKTTNPVGWFEIPVNEMPRAARFYERILNVILTLQESDGFKMAWFPKMIDNKYGATGTLVQGEGYTPSNQGALIYFSVEDINSSLETIEKAGGKTLLPKKHIGHYGFIAHFQDSEGNRVALHSMS